MAFQLKGNRKETENKTIRFPIHLIDQIEQAISDSDQDITFSSFVIQACEYALDHMDPRQKNTINFYFFQSRFLWFDVHFLAVLCFYFILPCFLFFSGQDPVLFSCQKEHQIFRCSFARF